MGQLKPDAVYVYERSNGTVYAREVGADPKDRFVVGYDFDNEYTRSVAEKYFLEVEWADILKTAKDNKALHDAIERVKILYHLSKEKHERKNSS